MEIATSRLILRPWNIPADTAAAFEFYSDPEVSRYIDGEPMSDPLEAERKLRFFVQHQATHGFSPWAVVEKKSGQVVGVCGLHKYNPEREVEIGFRIARRYWGQGIATEAAQGTINYGFGTLQLERIAAMAQVGNVGSQRTLRKLGFVEKGERILESVPYLYFELRNPGRLTPSAEGY